MEKKSYQGASTTGAPDLEYDLVAEMRALLKGNQALEQYIEDARDEGDSDALSCFQALHDQNRENVAKVRGLLAKRFARSGQPAAKAA